MSGVYFWWIGAAPADPALLSRVRGDAEAVFGVGTHVWHGHKRPLDAFDPRRQQHSSTRILKWLIDERPAQAAKVVGITDVDLFIPILTFVYGEAQLDGLAAVVSTARLTPPGAGAEPSPLTASRLSKECIHELGHTFGLIHCHNASCVMTRSVNLAQVDAKEAALCTDCWTRYRSAGERGVLIHEQGTDPDPRR